MPSLTTEEADALLPKAPTKSIIRPERLKYMVITPPKWGKTTTSTQIPDSILLACEEGHAFTETYKIIIDQWDRPLVEKQKGVGYDEDENMHMSMQEAVDLICASSRFQHVIIDTTDMAAKMCVDYWCNRLKVPHPADAGDFGKGFQLTLGDPFRRMMGPIIKSGRGLTWTTHAKWIEKKDKAGKVTSAKWESSLPSQVQSFIHSQADLIWQGKFGKLRPGMEERDRIVTIDASEEMMAGSRVRYRGEPWPMPKNFILAPVGGWDQWCSFFPVGDPEGDAAAAQACADAYAEYNELVLGKRAIEKESLVQASANATETAPAAPETPSEPTDSEPEAEESLPSHLATSSRVVRRKPAAATA
jgi:hypothetical protein